MPGNVGVSVVAWLYGWLSRLDLDAHAERHRHDPGKKFRRPAYMRRPRLAWREACGPERSPLLPVRRGRDRREAAASTSARSWRLRLSPALRETHTNEDTRTNDSHDDHQKAEQYTDLNQTHINTIYIDREDEGRDAGSYRSSVRAASRIACATSNSAKATAASSCATASVCPWSKEYSHPLPCRGSCTTGPSRGRACGRRRWAREQAVVYRVYPSICARPFRWGADAVDVGLETVTVQVVVGGKLEASRVDAYTRWRAAPAALPVLSPVDSVQW